MIATVLRRRLIFAPVRLSTVVKHFAGLEYRVQFYQLAREYLPEEADALAKLPPADGATRFLALFEKKYFPLADMSNYMDGTEYAIKRLVGSIPLRWLGMRTYDYDGYSSPAGHLLAASLCECPLRGQPGARVAVVDRFRQRSGENIPLPEKGWKLEQVEAAVGEKYPGLLDWCRWLFGRTGNRWLDKAPGDGGTPWSRRTVRALAKDWPGCREIENRMNGFSSWLRGDKELAKRAAEVVDYISQRIEGGKDGQSNQD